MHKKVGKRVFLLAIMYGGFISFLLTTNPNKLTIGWLIVPFIWLFVCLFFSVLLIMDVFAIRLARTKRQLSIATLIAIVPTTLLLLDSVNQLTLRDVLLILIFGTLAVFYTSKLEISK